VYTLPAADEQSVGQKVFAMTVADAALGNLWDNSSICASAKIPYATNADYCSNVKMPASRTQLNGSGGWATTSAGFWFRNYVAGGASAWRSGGYGFVGTYDVSDTSNYSARPALWIKL
jgi:hypothetical protein